ncbi:uncharacterized protein LOC141591229 [Silene latifolia]|uniref:uncharacterized protein LOC141591229 n=1 Tax=Silene latifolia TaxID=37657 RepID=UPI003D785C71
MPQVDLSSVCSGSGLTQVAAADEDAPPPQLDYAPESFWLSEDAELDWLDRNAFIDRKDSGKAASQQSHSTNLNPAHPSSAGSNRYSAKPSIIGLPKATKPNYAEAKNRRKSKTASIRLFPKRSESVGSKTGAGLSEPSSPKVSCMGRVRSRKDRSRKGKNRRKVTEPGGLERNKSIKVRKPGFWINFRSIFTSKSQNKTEENKEPELESATKRSNSKKKRGFSKNEAVEAPGIGGVKRFASGRRSDGWAGELVVDVAKSLDKGVAS